MNIKRAIAVSVTLATLAACAKGGIGLNRNPVRIFKPKPVQQVVVAETPAVKPVPATTVAAAPKKTVEEVVVAALKLGKPKTKKPRKRLTDLIVPSRHVAAVGACHELDMSAMPQRAADALAGSEVVHRSMTLSGTERDHFVAGQLLSGNLPPFLRTLTPVTFKGRAKNGDAVSVTICVMPDYLAVGDDSDFVRVPMGLPAAAEVANGMGFILPTTKMVDAIYSQAGLQLKPSPMQPGSQMSSTDYLWQHNQTVESQRIASDGDSELLVAGQKKDLVLSNVLRAAPGRVAIYGWHRPGGAPIQPLSTVHGETYADYSHGIRLVSTTAFVNGEPTALATVLEDPQMASLVSKEGPISHPLRLMAAISVE